MELTLEVLHTHLLSASYPGAASRPAGFFIKMIDSNAHWQKS